ncbi:MAG: methyl-accepting chemotaxis protein [Bacteroidota bacterium]
MFQESESTNSSHTSMLKASLKIREVLNVLSDIASQTNLLSLNASIEAARVGEQGRGFAVVAKEIRKLSNASADSSGQIRQMMGEVQTEADEIFRIKEAYEQEKALLDSLLNSSEDLIFFKDLNLKFTRVSKSMVSVFPGETPESLIGKSDFDFYSKEEATRYSESEKQLLTQGGEVADHINTERQTDGSIRFLLTTKFPLYGKDETVIGLYGITQDITHLEAKIANARKKIEGCEAEQKKIVNFMS